jgi:hypothetical protein
MRNLLLGAAAALGALAMASTAGAATFLVSDVGVQTWGNQVNVAGHTGEYATGIIFNNDLLVFCVDLEHNIGVTHYDPALVFTWGYLTVDGAGVAISEADSNRIGQLANKGLFLSNSSDPDRVDDVSAIQAAIWSIEYHSVAVSSKPEINTEIAHFINDTHDNGKGYARSLIAHGPGVAAGVQNMVPGFVPEPAPWALMIGGFGMAGGMLRRRRRTVA